MTRVMPGAKFPDTERFRIIWYPEGFISHAEVHPASSMEDATALYQKLARSEKRIGTLQLRAGTKRQPETVRRSAKTPLVDRYK